MSTVLLIHFNGTDGQTSYTAETGQTLTFNGTAQLDTAQKKFGTASLLVDSAGDSISVPDSDDWDFGTGDFTVEAFVRVGAVSSNYDYIVGNVDFQLGSAGWGLGLQEGKIRFSFMYSGGWAKDVQTVVSMSVDTWHHIAVTRSGTNLYIFLDGVLQSTTGSSGASISAGALPLYAGDGPSGSWGLNGHIDEIRVTKGEALWTSNFTVTTTEYPGGASSGIAASKRSIIC